MGIFDARDKPLIFKETREPLIFKETLLKRFTKNNTIDKLIVHCTGTDIKHDVYDVHNWHLKRGWAGIGYHFFIDKEGGIYLGRPKEYVGSHCYGKNSSSYGLCLEGNIGFTNEQAVSFLTFMGFIGFSEYLPKRKQLLVVPHNKFNPKKTCPNLDLSYLVKGQIKLTIKKWSNI